MPPIDLITLDSDIINCIVRRVDAEDVSSLAQTCRPFFRSCLSIYGSDAVFSRSTSTASLPVTGPATTAVTSSASSSSPSYPTSDGPSLASNHADHDSLASSDTEMTPTPEEDEWVFQITPDLMRRLSLLPDRNDGPTLPSLPTELQLQIFSYLDQIDSCCFGLTSRNSYVIYRAIHGTKMPLNTRRIGPNKLEAAWEVVGKQECKHCGMYRCELHEHIKSWMPKELEYCAMKQNFGIPAPGHANPTCYRGKPSKPRRCGRHPLRTTSIHQDDPHFKHEGISQR